MQCARRIRFVRSAAAAGLLIVLVLSCGGNRTSPSDFGAAAWIGDGRPLPSCDADFYRDQPAPLFRREFTILDSLRSATLFITAAGYYRASLNGSRIGDRLLDPAWTGFSKRIYYAVYDVTGALRRGANCLGVTLGNGFYNPLPLRMWGSRNLRKVLPVGPPAFIARLRIEYRDGRVQEVRSDTTWRWAPGPVLKNSVYLGEVYDGRWEIPGWDRPGMDTTGWRPVLQSAGPGGVLQPAFFPPIRTTATITPVSVSPAAGHVWIADMGVNHTGLYRIHLRGEPGDTVTFRFGERLYADGSLNPMTTVAGQIKRAGVGGPGAPDIAWQTDTYIFGENTNIWYAPEFTFHTFRYLEISGLSCRPAPGDIEGRIIHSDVDQKNEFSCSAGLINDIQDACKRTFLANCIGVQSDCPAREKFGYGGDLNATGEAFICSFDMQSFYRKTVYDWLDAMNDSVFVDTAPYVGIRYCGVSWESAFLITQYYLWLYYNDRELVDELYDRDLAWMDKAARIHPLGLVVEGLSDHESLQPVPVELTGTAHYLQCAEIMARFAGLQGDRKNRARFQSLADTLRSILREKFWDTPVPGPINRQTLFATLLYNDIVPEPEKGIAVDSLLAAVRSAPAGHFITGIFGTKYILEALSANGHGDMVFDIVNSREFPGWGYMIDRGATTIWETWKESDNTYSNCHPMFGSVSGWFYQWLGGIRPDPDYPGFTRFFITPVIPDGLSHMRCVYRSPHGPIVSAWKKDEQNRPGFEIEVPPGSTAMVRLPVGEGERMAVRKRGNDAVHLFPDAVDGSCRCELGGGEWEIVTVNK
ncbi:family 78 glycoside hydrolase catalytic domain [bacterium]|nr:family 78 glycoside hydrolase catalytic domain [bacterium]